MLQVLDPEANDFSLTEATRWVTRSSRGTEPGRPLKVVNEEWLTNVGRPVPTARRPDPDACGWVRG
jgi:hypothetical protein